MGNYASKIQADAKKLCPADTGLLRNSINTTVNYEGDEAVWKIGSNLEYAVYVEMGTGQVGADSKKLLPKGINPKYKTEGWYYKAKEGFRYTKGQPARPFLYPAFKSNESKINEYLKKGIQAHLSS